ARSPRSSGGTPGPCASRRPCCCTQRSFAWCWCRRSCTSRGDGTGGRVCEHPSWKGRTAHSEQERQRLDAQTHSGEQERASGKMLFPTARACLPLRVCASRSGPSCIQPLQTHTPHVPMPSRYPDPCPGILQRLVLQPLRPHAQVGPQRQQPILVGAHEVDHGLVAEPVTTQPNAAVEAEAHPPTAARHFPAGRCYEQMMRPPAVTVPTGAAAPNPTHHLW